MSRHRTVNPIAAGVATARGHRVFAALVVAVLALWAGPVRADDVMAGIDMFVTPPCGTPGTGGGTFVDFSLFPGPIPPNFFDPGSDPFSGTVPFTGQPLVTSPPNVISPVDTIVERPSPTTMLPTCGTMDSIPIEILALNLMSCAPITVTYGGGGSPELWDVDAALSPIFPQTPGVITIRHDCLDGGTFSATLPVTPKIVFTRRSDSATRTLDLGFVFPFMSNGVWVHTAQLGDLTTPGGFLVDKDGDGIPETGPVPGSSNFFPGVEGVPCSCLGPAANYAAFPTVERTPTGNEQHSVDPPLTPVCGDHVVTPPEDCDPPGSACGAFVCDANCTCPRCGNGIIDPGEQCDPPGSLSSACGGFVCEASCLCCFPTGPEVNEPDVPFPCSDMIDNDCDGLIDCDDPDCGANVCCCGRHAGETICGTLEGQALCIRGGGKCAHCPCICKDPTTIEFGPPGAGLDRLKSHGRVTIFDPVNVMGSEVGWLLTNASGRVFSVVLPPGTLTATPSGTLFTYTNRDARLHGGVYKAKIKITHSGTYYGYRVEAYGDMSRATDPVMSLQYYIGNQPTSAIHTETWRRTRSGWASHGFS